MILRGRAPQIFKNSCKPSLYVHNVHKMGFSATHLELIRQTPFGAFIDMEPFIFDGTLFSDIIKCYEGGDKFCFAEKVISFSVKEVALIIDLPYHGKRVAASKVLKERLFERFGTNMDLHHKGIERLIGHLKDSKEKEDIEGTVRLWIAYIFAMFLFSRLHGTCPRFLIPYLDDLS